MDNKDKLHRSFISTLAKKFGTYDEAINKFGTKKNGDIAKFLGHAESHLSELLLKKEKWSPKKYEREIDVAKRLIEHDNGLSEEKKKKWRLVAIFMFIGITSGIFGHSFFDKREVIKDSNFSTFDEKADISPYLTGDEAPRYCPCAAFEGEWALKNNYKFPLITKKGYTGLHYVAKTADVRFKCAKGGSLPFISIPENDTIVLGNKLYGFEVLESEIWYDTKYPHGKNSVDSFTEKTASNKTIFKPEYEELDFAHSQGRFKKVAVIKSEFLNEFTFLSDLIRRSGEHLGRHYTFQDSELISSLKIKELDLDYLIGRFKKTDCDYIKNPYLDPSSLNQNDTLSFRCNFMENVIFSQGVFYTKTYIFKNPHMKRDVIKNSCQ